VVDFFLRIRDNRYAAAGLSPLPQPALTFMNWFSTVLPFAPVLVAFGLMRSGIRLRLPLWLVILVGGLALACSSASVPWCGWGQSVLYLILGIFVGFTGVMASPLHICLLLSTSYFKADLGPTWRRLILPCPGLASTGLVLFSLTR
jgi:hypothetical protein